VALLGGVLAILSRNSAQDAERGAEAQALTADAQRIGALSRAAPTLAQSMLYAAAAVDVEDTVETRGDLLAALQRNVAAVRSLPLSSTSLTGAAVSPDGRLLASTDAAGVVRFIDLSTWAPSGAPVELGRPIDFGSIAFSPDGRTLAVTTRQNDRVEVQLIDVQTRDARSIGSWNGLGPSIDNSTTGLAFAPDGRRLAVGLATIPPSGLYPTSQRLLLLDARSGRPLWQRRYPHQPEQWEAHLSFLPDGRLLTSAQQGETLVWDASAGRILRRYAIGGRFALSPDRRRIAIARNSHFPGDPSSSITVLHLRTGEYEDLAPRLNASWIGALVYTRDGNRIVAAATDVTTVWDVEADEIVETYGTKLGPPTAGVVLDRRGLALDSRYDGTVTVWDPEATQRIGRRFYWDSGTRGCFGNPCAVLAPRGDVMAASRGDGTVTLVDLRSRRRIADLPARDGTLAEAMAFTPDGRRLATGGIAGTVTIRDVRSRAVVLRLSFGAPVNAVAFSPDGRLIAVQHKREEAAGATVEVRRLRSDATVYSKTLAGGPGELAFTRDGRVLVASACCATVVAWDARSGEQRLRVAASDQANTFAVSPNSQLVAAGSTGGRVRLWDLDTGKSRGAATKVAGANINQLAISPDGRLLAVGAFDGTATVWDLRTRTRLGDSFPVVRGLAPQMAFKPDGRLIVGEHVSAIEWPLDRPTLQRFACQVAGRDMTRAEWEAVLPNQRYRPVC
jgi:WD40 repeat protein